MCRGVLIGSDIMKKTLFNKNWRFAFESELDEFNTYGYKYSDAEGAASRFYPYSNWEPVDLPHDWAVRLEKSRDANTFAGAYPNTHYHRFMTERRSEAEKKFNVGWYRKEFEYDPAWDGKRVFIEFEGIFRDSIVWVNGVYLDRHASGYTSFSLELTDHLFPGEINSVAVRVDSDQPEGWWYEGAGIYRNVYLKVCEPVYFKYCSTAVRTQLDGTVAVSAEIVNDTAEAVEKTVKWSIANENGATVAEICKEIALPAFGEAVADGELKIADPRLWSIDDPYLYTLRMSVGEEEDSVRFGVRTVAFDSEKGFLLNGVPQKLRGACVHQDFGGVGVALSDNLNEYKIARLKEMGVNAYRCSHHAPSPALLDACDRLGMLVMDETRMFGTSPEAMRQLTSLIERDRNHPSVFIWSLGNEEFSVQNDEISYRLLEKASRTAKLLDPTREITYGGNNGSNFTGANGAAGVRGINYIRNDITGHWIDEYHKAHSNQPIIGTEESSYVLSRGGAVNDMGNGLIDSSGNVTMPWGSTPKGWVKYYEDRDYLAGGFMWTGFDYRGEPNPFYYQNVISSFGTIDLCGMEKPPFHYYRAWWTDEPVLKITPHWNHKRGDVVKVTVFTNCERISLFLNGRPVGECTVNRFDAPQFDIPFEAGTLSADGIKNGRVIRDAIVTSGKTAEIRCTEVLRADGEDGISVYELDAYDKNGIFCPTATEMTEITVRNGELVGVGNGDPSEWGPEQFPMREDALFIRNFACENGVYSIPRKTENKLAHRYDFIEREGKTEGYEDDYRTVARYAYDLAEPKKVTLTSSLTGAEKYEYIEFERLGCDTQVFLNGKLIADVSGDRGGRTRNAMRPYRFYTKFKKGINELKLVALQNESDPPVISGYVKLGRRVSTPGYVKLHYGRARIFVRSKEPANVKISYKTV